MGKEPKKKVIKIIKYNMARVPFKLKSQGSSFKEMGSTPAPISKPASSKEELIRLANQPPPELKHIDLDYGGGFGTDYETITSEAGTTAKPKPGDPEKPIVTRTPEQIMGIEQDRIKVKGANKQDTYKSGGGFGKDNKDIKAPEVKTITTADESKNTPSPKIRVMTPKESMKKHKDSGKPVTQKEINKTKKTNTTTTVKPDNKKNSSTNNTKSKNTSSKKKKGGKKKKGSGKLKKFFKNILKKK